MTRINSGIHPTELPDKLLLAEHREIKRLPNHLAKYGFDPKRLKDVPKKFKLGKGHVLFFLWKGSYTYARYLAIHWECKRRGFDVKNYGRAWKVYENFPLMFNIYNDSRDKEIVQARIEERGFKLLKRWHTNS